MKICTDRHIGDVKLFADSILKSWLAVAIVLMAIKQVEYACTAVAIMGVRAALRGHNPLYLGLTLKTIQESSIVKYGLPVVLALATILLVQTLYVYQ